MGRTAARVLLPREQVARFGGVELWMRRHDPGCHLSWLALAAVDAARPGAGDGTDWLRTGRELCAGGRDLATHAGWTAAVRGLDGSQRFLEQVIAGVDLYESTLQQPHPAAREAVTAARYAIGQIGRPYVWGGDGPGHGQAGFDCSGLTSVAYHQAGVVLPRTADAQSHAVSVVPADASPRLGDLVFYGNRAGFIHHVGVYIGNGQMINAPDFGMAVQVNPVRKPGDDYAGAGRPVG